MAITVIINKKSGTVATLGEEAVAARIKDILGSELSNLQMLGPEEMDNILAGFDGKTTLLIGGGDGTIRTVAAILKSRNIPFGVLPLGTMNLFAKDLRIPVDFYQAVEAYKQSRVLKIDAAFVNDQLFLCNVMIGALAELAKEREQQRNNETLLKWIALTHKTIVKLSSSRWFQMALTSEGRTRHKASKVIIVSNNEYDNASGIASFKKKALTDGKLAVYLFNTAGTLAAIALLSKIAMGSWTEAMEVESFNAQKLKLQMYKMKTNVLVDGEIFRMKLPVHFRIEPKALSVLVPQNSELG